VLNLFEGGESWTKKWGEDEPGLSESDQDAELSFHGFRKLSEEALQKLKKLEKKFSKNLLN
jgi:hypothetical protein